MTRVQFLLATSCLLVLALADTPAATNLHGAGEGKPAADEYEPAQANTSIVLITVLVVFFGGVSLLQKSNFDRMRKERLASPAYAKDMLEAKLGVLNE